MDAQAASSGTYLWKISDALDTVHSSRPDRRVPRRNARSAAPAAIPCTQSCGPKGTARKTDLYLEFLIPQSPIPLACERRTACARRRSHPCRSAAPERIAEYKAAILVQRGQLPIRPRACHANPEPTALLRGKYVL